MRRPFAVDSRKRLKLRQRKSCDLDQLLRLANSRGSRTVRCSRSLLHDSVHGAREVCQKRLKHARLQLRWHLREAALVVTTDRARNDSSLEQRHANRSHEQLPRVVHQDEDSARPSELGQAHGHQTAAETAQSRRDPE
eukprot:4460048-Pleurochrysis_carterae.AAC.3